MKLGLVVTDGVGVRNFVHGRFLDVAAAVSDSITLYSGVPVAALRDLAGDPLAGVNLVEMPVYWERTPARFWRKALFMVMALLARFFLNEQISVYRWAGIALIALGVGFVTQGPSRTEDARGTEVAPPFRPGLTESGKEDEGRR